MSEPAQELVVTPGELPRTFSDREWPKGWMGKFLDSLAMTPNAAGAARAAGVNRQYAYECRDRWPEFREAWEQACRLGADVLEANALRWATVGQDVTETREVYDSTGNLVSRTVVKTKLFSPTLTQMVLRRWKPEYKDHVEVKHTGTVAAKLEVDRVPTRERMLELADLARRFSLPEGDEHPVIDAGGNGAG